MATITLKRIDGSIKELSEYKKGKRYSTVIDAETELWKMALTAPHTGAEEGHRVAYEVENQGQHYYGTLVLFRPAKASQRPVDFRRVVEADYGTTVANGLP